MARKFLDWKTLRDGIWSPRVDEQEIEECLRRVRRELPTPVFWLLGKTQSGKTSIVRALTGSERAEIGGGFRPCTRTANAYAFPSEDDCLLRFLDTRGLGEAAYDPAEDLKAFGDQSHLLIVVMKALDHAQHCVLEPLRTILKAHPRWPLIVAQTCLHEGYPAEACGIHPSPYPFRQLPYSAAVPSDLSRSLAAQRELFLGLNARFVPVDFTLPEDGFAEEHYGLDALWDAIEDALPLGLRGMLCDTAAARDPLRDVYFRAAHPAVLSYAVAAGMVAALPVPVVDVPLVLALQGKMFHAIASVYGQSLNTRRLMEVFGALGMGFVVRLGGRELAKAIPGVGSVVASLFAAASTYALGRTLCLYFSRVQHGDVPDAATIRKLYAEQYAEGRERLRSYFEKTVRK